MDKVYAVAVDAFCHGTSVRGSYTIAKGPFAQEEEAIAEIDNVVNELADRYSSLGTCGQDNKIAIKTLNDKTKIFVKEESMEPILRCSVLGVDMSNIVCLNSPLALRSGSSKKATIEQKHISRMKRKISQYVATLTPAKLDLSGLTLTIKEN